jgi:hypothetical protein
MLFIQGTSIQAPPERCRTPAPSTVSNSLQALFSTRICGTTVGLMAGVEDARKGSRHLSKGVAAEPCVRTCFEGYGLQPVHEPPKLRRALAPEGTSCTGLSSPRRLKPIHLDNWMYGLKGRTLRRRVLTQGLKPNCLSAPCAARLKSCPDTKHQSRDS